MLQWQSQDAKAKFSEIMRMAQEAPQVITVRGKEEAVLVSKAYFDSLTQAKPSLTQLMQASQALQMGAYKFNNSLQLQGLMQPIESFVSPSVGKSVNLPNWPDSRRRRS